MYAFIEGHKVYGSHCEHTEHKILVFERKKQLNETMINTDQ